MSLDHLWAGWRADYVASVGHENDNSVPNDGVASEGDRSLVKDDQACVFCRILASDASDEERYVVKQGSTCAAILNAYPYASGHLLILPLRHVDDFDTLSEDEANELWAMTREATKAINAAYDADGLNIGANLGRAAGAGIPAHLHLHVVPRWIGDTNFMTAVASVRVMPEALHTSWRKLTAAWPT